MVLKPFISCSLTVFLRKRPCIQLLLKVLDNTKLSSYIPLVLDFVSSDADTAVLFLITITIVS